MSQVLKAAPIAFDMPVRVYYDDTDAGGVVYHANYLKFFERARTEWLRSLGFDQRTLASELDTLFIVRRADTHFKAPARLDDQLTIRSVLTHLGRASFECRQVCLNDDQALASASVQVGCLRASTFRPAAMPGKLQNALAGLVAPADAGSVHSQPC